MTELIDIASAREIFVRWLPSWFEFFDELDNREGRLEFKPELGPYLKANSHDSYPLLYERLPQIMEAARLAIERNVSNDLGIPDLGISLATPQNRGRFLLLLLSDFDELEPLMGPHLTEHDRDAAESAAKEIDSEVLAAAQPLLKVLPGMFMALFHEYLSVAVHGIPLSTLVRWAQAGDVNAYGKAIQIDGRILVKLPYFAERYAQARLEGDRAFLRMVAHKADSPAYKGRLKQKRIWLVVALLDLFGLLESMSGEELLDLCDAVGANDGDTPIEDVKNMLKRVATYKRYQREGPLSTP